MILIQCKVRRLRLADVTTSESLVRWLATTVYMIDGAVFPYVKPCRTSSLLRYVACTLCVCICAGLDLNSFVNLRVIDEIITILAQGKHLRAGQMQLMCFARI